MYAQVEKSKENKSRAIVNSITQKKSNVKQGFGFVDNRPEAIAQRKHQEMSVKYSAQLHPILKKENKNLGLSTDLVQRHVIQFTMDELIDELIKFVKANDQKGFSTKLRAMWPGMDEMISCEVAFKLAREAYQKGDMVGVRDICFRAHETRLPTEWTGSREISSDGTVSTWAHPTATVGTMPNHPWSMPVGNSGIHYRSTGHTTFNRGRAKSVLAETGGPHEQQGRAISPTLRSVAPPFAPGVQVNPAISEAKKVAFNAQRDDIKKLHPDYDPSRVQARNAPWKKKRRVSPDRTLPDV